MTDVSESQHKRIARRPLVPLLLLIALATILFLVCRHVENYMLLVRQTALLGMTVDGAILTFNNEFGRYPPSAAFDDANLPYCGAMKLAEALAGQDLCGFHPSSRFRLDGSCPDAGELLYTAETLGERRGPFLSEPDRVHRLVDVYGRGNTGAFAERVYVLCDVYERKRPGGKKTGMPILYYRADVNETAHDVNDPANPQNIYDYRDNQMLIDLGVPGKPGKAHPLADPKRFYMNMRSHKSPEVPRPYCADSYILISAGRDGLYGTADDICNFDWKYRE